MKSCCEYIREHRYKFRMMDIPVELSAYVFGDNNSVLINSLNPDSLLKEKSTSVAYHFVREGVAKNEWKVAYISTHENPADILTKPSFSSDNRAKFIAMILHHLTME